MPPTIGKSTTGRDIRINVSRKAESGIDRQCDLCGKDMHTTKFDVSRGRGKYCCRACSLLGIRKQVEVFCEVCGLVFMRQTAEIGRRKKSGTFCSQECFKIKKRLNAHSYPKIGQRHAHRIVAEAILGRALKPGEIVHHKDRNKRNFSEDNLEVCESRSAHSQLHHDDISKSTTESNKRRARKT
jgi:hypothetical protein